MSYGYCDDVSTVNSNEKQKLTKSIGICNLEKFSIRWNNRRKKIKQKSREVALYCTRKDMAKKWKRGGPSH